MAQFSVQSLQLLRRRFVFAPVGLSVNLIQAHPLLVG
jgi:hypothetical protein